MAPSASSSRIASTVADGSGPLRTRSPATRIASGLIFLRSARTAANAAALPWTSDSTATRVMTSLRLPASPEHRSVRDDEAQRRLARHLTVDRGDPPAASEPPAELLHRHFEA